MLAPEKEKSTTPPMKLYTCRICEEDFKSDELKQHTQYCAIINNPNILQLSFEDQLRAIANALQKVYDERLVRLDEQHTVDESRTLLTIERNQITPL